MRDVRSLPPSIPPDDRAMKAVAFSPPAAWPALTGITAPLALRVECIADLGLFVTRIESSDPGVVLFDADFAHGSVDLIAFVRSLWPARPIFAIVHPWSERADLLRALVDGLLFKPPRPAQWRSVLDRGILAPPPSCAPGR